MVAVGSGSTSSITTQHRTVFFHSYIYNKEEGLVSHNAALQ